MVGKMPMEVERLKMYFIMMQSDSAQPTPLLTLSVPNGGDHAESLRS